MEPVNPWAGPAGVRARQVQLRHLAAGDGEVADFAREVLAGRARTRDLLYSSALGDRALQPVRDLVDRWNRLSDVERQRLAVEAADQAERSIAELIALEPEPAPSERSQPRPPQRGPVPRAGDDADDDGDEGGTFLSDAW